MMPHRFSTRITKYDWLDVSLRDFYWPAQSVEVRQAVIAWLDAWYRRLFLRETRPQTILALWGANGTGKTTAAKGIAHFHLLNLGCASLEFLPWAAFVDDQLNGQTLHPNWEAHLLIIDDLDSRRPVPESKSTWLLDKLSGRLKYRAEMLHRPTLLTSNRNPLEMRNFLTTSSTGKTDEEVKQSATTLISAFDRHLFLGSGIEFLKKIDLEERTLSNREYYDRLSINAGSEHNDLVKFGFNFLEEKYGEETWWQTE